MYVRIHLACVCSFVSVLFISSKCSHLIITYLSHCRKYTFVPRTATFKKYAFLLTRFMNLLRFSEQTERISVSHHELIGLYNRYGLCCL